MIKMSKMTSHCTSTLQIGDQER